MREHLLRLRLSRGAAFAGAAFLLAGLGASLGAAAQPEPPPDAPPPPAPSASPAAPSPAPPALPIKEPESPAPPAPPKPETKPDTKPEAKPEPQPPSDATKTVPPAAKPLPPADQPPPKAPASGFSFGSYGRMIAATDLRGRPGRDSNIVAHGSRLDEGDYVELELRRDDVWAKTDSTTRVVATLAVADPLFHYTGQFTLSAAMRNLYIEEHDLVAKGLSVWAGSRMYRGDDIYLLDWWPLDNLNTLGAGIRYDAPTKTAIALHIGVEQPTTGFFAQIIPEPNVYNQPGQASVTVLNRQTTVGSLKIEQQIPLSKDGAGLKGILYGEFHDVPTGQDQTSQPNVFETLPSDKGFVVGAQFGAFTGQRDTHVNLFLRYATGLAAYPDLTEPFALGPDKTSSGAHELVVALGANYEIGPFGVMLGGYVRSFRDATADLDYGDVDEGIVVARPAVFFGESGGLAVEASYQAQQRGVLTRFNAEGKATTADQKGPLAANETRLGVIPFLSPAGRGNYSRPQFRIIYAATFRNQGAKSLYPLNDVFSLHDVEHFLGVGAEWWFNSTSYGG